LTSVSNPKNQFHFRGKCKLNSLSDDEINKQGGIKATLSNLVGRTGFEPATPWSQTRYSTGLNYLPNSGSTITASVSVDRGANVGRQVLINKQNSSRPTILINHLYYRKRTGFFQRNS
jgi:hypothetical protein